MGRRINLVPPSERTRTTTDVGLLAMLVLGIVVVFGLVLGYYLLDGQLADKEQELADLEQQVAQVQAEVAALRQFEVISAQRDRVEALVEGIYSARTIVSGILDDISLVIPDTIWFQNLGLVVADPVVVISGAPAGPAPDPSEGTSLTVDGNTYSFGEVAQLLVRFQLVPSLQNVQLVTASGSSAEGADQEVKQFTMKGAVIDTSTEEILPLSEIRVDVP